MAFRQAYTCEDAPLRHTFSPLILAPHPSNGALEHPSTMLVSGLAGEGCLAAAIRAASAARSATALRVGKICVRRSGLWRRSARAHVSAKEATCRANETFSTGESFKSCTFPMTRNRWKCRAKSRAHRSGKDQLLGFPIKSKTV